MNLEGETVIDFALGADSSKHIFLEKRLYLFTNNHASQIDFIMYEKHCLKKYRTAKLF